MSQSEAGRALLLAVGARDLPALHQALDATCVDIAPAGAGVAPVLAFRGLPALHLAALRDWAPGIEALLAAGADVNAGLAVAESDGPALAAQLHLSAADAFHPVSGPWGPGFAWPSFPPGRPGAAVEEAHWAATLLACPLFCVTDELTYAAGDFSASPLPRIAGQRRRRRLPHLLRRLLQLHSMPEAAAAAAAAAEPAGPSAAAAASTAGPAGLAQQQPQQAQRQYSYAWLADHMLFIKVVPGQPARFEAALASLAARPATRAALAAQAAAPRQGDAASWALASLALAERKDLVDLLVGAGAAVTEHALRLLSPESVHRETIQMGDEVYSLSVFSVGSGSGSAAAGGFGVSRANGLGALPPLLVQAILHAASRPLTAWGVQE
ncbi:hypothetical protein ABPG75_004485 [Micractinium tetrahymenae]